MSGIKKIYFYRHDQHETVVDIYDAKEWENFLIIRVGSAQVPITQEIIDQVSGIVDQIETNKYSQIIIMPADIELEFFGVETEDE